MESFEERMKKIEFYQKLLLDMMKDHSYPVYDLIVRNGLTEEEVEDLYALCEELSEKYEEQKELGYVHFRSLLTHFIGMLNMKLDPKQTIEAFYSQNMYKPLMNKLKILLTEVPD